MRTLIGFVASSALVVGCTTEVRRVSTTEGDATAADPTSLCATFCARNAACDSKLDEQTCNTTCDDKLGGMKKVRADLLGAARECFEASDCREVLGGDRLAECIAESAVSVAPTAAGKKFCDDLIASQDKCGDMEIDRAKCLSFSKTFSDTTLSKASTCTSKSCAQIMPCVDAETSL